MNSEINGINDNDSKETICGIIILLGAVICMIPLFTLVKYAFTGESPYSFALLIRNLACAFGFAITGFGVIANKHDLLKIGLFINAGAFLIDTYFPLVWISSNTRYYESLSRGLGDGNFLLLICDLSALVGFLLMGIIFSQKPEWQFPNIRSIAPIFMAAYIVCMIVYALYYTKSNFIPLGSYLLSYITGSHALAVVGAAGVIMLPYVITDPLSQEYKPFNQDVIQASAYTADMKTTTAGIASEETTDGGIISEGDNAVETEPKNLFEAETVNLLRKYKQLLDMGIITEEEFKSKKEELLK